ncbi:Polyadenylate-binding protein-interacting protein 4 [Nymphaea thermarum]|nr:Polyadenylate-binding protein-interacting protein 4 [Nymphaea thermarum]
MILGKGHLMASKSSQQMNGSILSSSNDALVYTTMCVVGLPVEVQVKDGSIYAGIFHTACIERDYGVVLKMARMIRRGINTEGLVGEAIIDTLVVLPEDLVQVAAKGVMLPSDGHPGDIFNEDKAAISYVSGTVQPPNFDCEREVKLNSAKLHEDDRRRSTEEALVDGQQKSMIKSEGCVEAGNHNRPPVEKAISNGFKTTSACPPDNSEQTKDKDCGVPCSVEEASSTVNMDDERQVVQYGLQEEQNASTNHQRQSEETLVREVQCSVSPNMVQMVRSVTTMDIGAFDPHVKPGSVKTEKVPCEVPLADGCSGPSSLRIEKVEQLRNAMVTPLDVPSSNPSTPSPSSADFPSVSSLSSVPPATDSVISKSAICNQSSKEFKLNPGAKIFSPSSMNLRTSTPTVSNVDQVVDVSTLPIVDAQPGVQFNHPIPHAGLPVKYAPHSNLAAGNGGSYPQNPQHSGAVDQDRMKYYGWRFNI